MIEKQKIALPVPSGNIKQLESQIRSAKIGLSFIKEFIKVMAGDLDKKNDAVDKIYTACTTHSVSKDRLIELNIDYSIQFASELNKFSKLKQVSMQELRKKTPDELKRVLFLIADAIIRSGSKGFADTLIETLANLFKGKVIDLTVENIIAVILSGDKQAMEEIKNIYHTIQEGKDDYETVKASIVIIKKKLI